MFFVGGNWKMNGNVSLLDAFASLCAPSDTEVVLFPPAPLLTIARSTLQVPVGAQNCHYSASGAFTGEVSPRLLAELGVPWVLLGHSERRRLFGEADVELIGRKLEGALREGLRVVLCVGETLEERERNETERVLEHQLSILQAIIPALTPSNLIIAYEPVWAIGTGHVATPDQIRSTHSHIRTFLTKLGVPAGVRIIYGGSVTAGSAGELRAVEGVDGFLVGGASLKQEEFERIIGA